METDPSRQSSFRLTVAPADVYLVRDPESGSCSQAAAPQFLTHKNCEIIKLFFFSSHYAWDFCFKMFIGVELLYSVALVSALWQSETAVHIYPVFFGFLSH